jgi:hypothetical protein
LLRPCSKRPCHGRTGNSFDEIAPSHCLPFRLRTNATLQLHQGFATGGMGFSGQFALHGLPPGDVRLTPKSGHWRTSVGCPLCVSRPQPISSRSVGATLKTICSEQALVFVSHAINVTGLNSETTH